MTATNRTPAYLAMATCLLLPAYALAHSDTAYFTDTAFTEAPQIVDCTLEDGTQTQCHEIKVGYLPEGLEIGPFCPATLDDAGGIWEWSGENAGLYRIDRDYLTMMDQLGYTFYDEDGTVHVVDNATQQPTVDHACINVSADESVEITILLPVYPVMADEPTSLGTVAKVGVALDGVPIFADAPSIQATGHMPALDTCGGHIDPGGWYHWHATSTDVQTVFENEDVIADCTVTQDATAQFGYAFDGFAMFGSLEADGSTPEGLDQCGGHVGITPSGEELYHYHASDEFPNLPSCLSGVQAVDNFTTTATAGVGAQNAGAGGRNEPPRPTDGGPAGMMPPGFEDAAASLGVTAGTFMQAIEGAGGRDLDIAAAAHALGVTEDELRAVLPQPPR